MATIDSVRCSVFGSLCTMDSAINPRLLLH
jgi:hypothetical protein